MKTQPWLDESMAPNGKPVTENFHAWFFGSKVVTTGGTPLVVYHGSASDVTEFDPARSGSKSKTGAPEGTFFFTDKPDVASSYTVAWQGDFSSRLHDGANVIPAYLSIARPLRLSAKGCSWREIAYKGELGDINEIAALVKASGRYDGLIVTRIRDKGVGNVINKISTTFVAFRPQQIKSALGNSGLYLPDSPSLTDHNPGMPLDIERRAAKTLQEQMRTLPTVGSAMRSPSRTTP